MTNNKITKELEKFVSSNDYKNYERKQISEKELSEKTIFVNSLEEIFDLYNIKDGATLSFHHHLRNGDYVLNNTLEVIKKRDLKDICIAASSVFPNNKPMAELIKSQNVTKIHTNYLNGEVSKVITDGYLRDGLFMYTHGGRALAIERGDIKIDVAILGCPTVDKLGNGTGAIGKSACGSLGYALSDVKYAKKVVLVTDNLVDSFDSLVSKYEIEAKYVDAVVVLDSIGDANGIVSGTTKITKDPVGLKIARDTASLLAELGLIYNGFSMQTGAGGTSLATCAYCKEYMKKNDIKAKFATGGITGYFVEMLEEGLVENLYDVQCFDLKAVKSYGENPNHHGMSASFYANPYDENCIVNKLDFVILGATEIDKNFNVNVTTDSHGNIIGGSGGHADTAHGAFVTVITTNLVKSRMPIIKDKVTTITTPGEDIDVLVTERGIAINPLRKDLLAKLENTKLNIKTMEELMAISEKLTGKPKVQTHSEEVVGYVIYRDGKVIDYIYKK